MSLSIEALRRRLSACMNLDARRLSSRLHGVKKLPEGRVVGSYDLTDDPAPVIDGFSLNLNGGAVKAGDTFKITPTRNGASQLSTSMTDIACGTA